jgi:ribosomal protein S18 acetylase RimI-like enzyme
MKIEIKHECKDIDWKQISELLKSVGMAWHSPERHKAAFEASYCAVFLYADDQLVGFGRAISDGAYQAAIYDCAVSEAYQGRGLGKLIIKELLAKIPGCNVILYATPGKEGFYEKLGFRKMKTGLACFINRDGMQKRGFTE